MTDRLVVDASVAAKWFLRDEAQSEEAVQLLASALDQTLELHAPSLLAFELYRVVSRACVARQSPEGRPRITLREGVAAVDDFHGLPIVLHPPSREFAHRTVALAVEHRKSASDLSYLALAEALDCQVCTADTRMTAGVSASFPRELVVLLGNL